MIYTNVLVRSLKELSKTNVRVRHALVTVAHKEDKSETYPIVYQYIGTRNRLRKDNEIAEEDIIGEMTNIHQDEISGDILCDVTIYDVKKDSVNFDFKIDNLVIRIDEDGEESVVNGIIYNKYAKDVIDKKRQLNQSNLIEKVDPSPIPDDIANDKSENPLFNTEVQESIKSAMEGGEIDGRRI